MVTDTPRPTAESLLADALANYKAPYGARELLAASPELAAALSDSARLLVALKNLSDRHEWQPDAGPCICFAHVEARALLAQPTPDDKPSLDAAWEAAEKALPNERWRIGAVKRLNDGPWRAYAEGPIREGWTKSADGPTPTAALLNLATALTKP